MQLLERSVRKCGVGCTLTLVFNAALVFVSVILPAFLTYVALASDTATNILALSCGVVAFTLMATNLFLATRPPIVERLMGGLDQVYFAHKWIGISVLILAVGHEGIGMDLDGSVLTRGTASLAKEVAEFVFPVLIVLLSISFIKRIPKLPFEIPYQFWRMGHRLLGVVFMALVFHQFFVKAPVEANSLLSSFLQIAAITGVLSFLYTQFGAFFRRRKYTISSVEKHPAATIIEATPVGGFKIKPRPGNFAFLSIKRKGLREPHPFTISQARDDGTIQFSVRGLGDFTKYLRDNVQVGDAMTIEGGYGRFDYRRGNNQQIWVAGGIGVTPFLAFCDSIKEDNQQRIHFYYCVGKEEEAVGLERIKAAAGRSDKFSYTLFVSANEGRFSAKYIMENAPIDQATSSLWFCGPGPMREAIVGDLKKAGKTPQGVHYEKFEFR